MGRFKRHQAQQAGRVSDRIDAPERRNQRLTLGYVSSISGKPIFAGWTLVIAIHICALNESFLSKIANHPPQRFRAVVTQYAMKGSIVTTGTVKWFNSAKGYGFIQPDNGGPDAFVHISAVERAGMREIVEGQKLGYDMQRDSKSGKMSACNLQAA
jgi:CspA family cold shock protein